MRCSKCGADNQAGDNFCAHCGAALAHVCVKCGAELRPGSNFCSKCGVSISAIPAALPKKPDESQIRVADVAAAESLEGERKTVTALFADIKGSMDLMEDLDPEDARAIVDPALKLMMEAVQRYGGHVAQSTGDGIFALFGAPVAYEDHPQRALHAALRLQEEMQRYSAKLRESGQLPLEARVGVNTGEMVLRLIQTAEGRTEYAPVGHSTGLAARMQALAPTGSIAVTDATRELCEGYFRFKSLGPTRVKGVREPVSVYEVTGLGPLRTRLQRSASRGLSKFVGRGAEMEAMRRALELAKTGRGQIVAAVGEPGVGKSRLFFEFKAVSQSGWLLLETSPVSHGKTNAYAPVIELLWKYFQVSAEDDQRTRRERVSSKVVALDPSLEGVLPYLFNLLGIVEGNDPLAQMDAQIKNRRKLDAIKRILFRESLKQPVMLIFEDLHWIDDETQALLDLLVDSIATAEILLVVNYRPEYSHQWGSKTYYTQLRLDPLGRESAAEMLESLLGDSAELDPLKGLITEKTDGTPLFMEEAVEMLLNDGSVVRDGGFKLVKPLAELKIPPTVQAILTSRIDHLPPAEKDLLQTLAVIGRTFGVTLVSEVSGRSDEDLARLLSNLQIAEFIYEQPAVSDIEYTFKHALTQEVAYNGILIARRKTLHERAARSIEIVFVDRLDDKLDQLAYHYRQSGNAAKAVFYLDLASRRAMQASAYSEAVALLGPALELVKALPEDRARDRMEISLCLNLYEVAKVVGVSRFASAEILNRARGLCEKIQDDSELFKVLEYLADYHGNLLDAGGTIAVRDDLLRVARRIENPSLLARVHYGLGRTFMIEGHFKNAGEHFRHALDPDSDQASAGRSAVVLKSACYGMSSWNLWLLGYPTMALARARESVAILTAGSTPVASARSLAGRSALHLLMRSPDAAMQDADAALEISKDRGLSGVLGLGDFYRSWALIQRGDAQQGIMLLLGGRRPMPGIAGQIRKRAAKDGGWGGSTLTRLFNCVAEGCLGARYIEPGLEVVDESLAVVHASGVAMYEAEMYRLKGELLLAQDTAMTRQAEECFRTAIDTSRWQSGKSWELRATTSLARLLDREGRRDEARAMLLDIYNWFTEGFDTADLKDAKALLDELGTS